MKKFASKKLIWVFIGALMFAASSCGGEAKNVKANQETVVCLDYCQKACCLGCKATEGDRKCIFLADGSMPCCVVKVE